MKSYRGPIYSTLDLASKAVTKLNISTEKEYRIRYREDPRLPAHPYRFYVNEWSCWPEFFKTGLQKYQTLEEARAACTKLGIKSGLEYKTRYKEDPRLPSTPMRNYKCDMYAVLNRTKPQPRYRSLKEASKVTQRLGIQTRKDYYLGYQVDAKLRKSPDRTYSKEWVSWSHYLGIVVVEKYETLLKASNASFNLNIKTQKEYKRRYKEDPKLQSNPSREYKDDWVSWKVYLKTAFPIYETIQKASKAAIKLGFRSEWQYHRQYKKDIRLPYSPDKDYAKEWVNWFVFLKQVKPVSKYACLKTASDAAIKLKIQGQSDYYKLYREDPRLPSCPALYYSKLWKGWGEFLNRKKTYYITLKEASDSAISLGIKTGREYGKKFKCDPKLHYDPRNYYLSEWNGFGAFLNTEIHKYKNIREASRATLALGIDSCRSYLKNCKDDNKLPRHPQTFYKVEWQSWNKFLNLPEKYKTLKEASVSAVRLHISSSVEYSHRYKEDPRLYCIPKTHEPNAWIDWRNFLSKEVLLKFNQGWKVATQAFLRTQQGIDTKNSVISKYYDCFFRDSEPTQLPSQMLHRDYQFDVLRYEALISDQASTSQLRFHNIMVLFFDWIIDNYCTDKDEYEELVLPGYRNPLKTLMGNIKMGLPKRVPTESVRPVLPLSIVETARMYLFGNQFSGFKSATHLHNFFEKDWLDIDKKSIDFADDDCAWRIKPESTLQYQIWSPVKAVALYTLLKVPLRGQQILWLDSGEGDDEIPLEVSPNAIKWVKNSLGLSRCRVNKRGFIKKLSDGAEGMFITTNKTSAREGGYSVPYIPHDLALLVIRLRNWQSKYNPLKEMTKWTEVELPRKINERILTARGETAFLFRNPAKPNGDPINTSMAFTRSLPRLLYLIQNGNENLAHIDKGIYRSQYTPHSMRTSLITAYVVDGGVPIHVISKLVGHASIVMTIYYTKIGHGTMRKELCKAEKKALKECVHRLEDTILSDSIEKAKGELYARDSVFLNDVTDSWPKASYQFTDKGICAMGGGGCDTGGTNEYGEADNSPVLIGYLGKRNCVRCRYFITGPAFLGGLGALCNELLLEIKTVSIEQLELQRQADALKDEKYDVEKAGGFFLKTNILRRNEADIEEKTMKLDVFISDFAATQNLMNESRIIMRESNAIDRKLLIAPTSLVEMDFRLEEPGTDFKLLNEICENATIYSTSSASRAIPKRSQMIDRLATQNGLNPLLYRLSEEEQLIVGNQASVLIQSYVSSWQDIEKLFSGELLFDDLDRSNDCKLLSTKFHRLMSSANKVLLEGNI
ncbi:VPA1269 family protein [Paraglaciecola sp. L1A13]|uniref:VPA1269 family protein n=1 Tax=Paraglaciecola sp. L1A13 TaxID=2686359 RepID=UPI00131E1775|nr:VPA1269 family protein [Paraglaciecola sp. L1A13]